MKVRNIRKQHQLSMGIALCLSGALDNVRAHWDPRPVVSASLMTPKELKEHISKPVVNVSNEGRVNVVRKKDGTVLALAVTIEYAEEMVAAAKRAKKASLQMVPA